MVAFEELTGEREIYIYIHIYIYIEAHTPTNENILKCLGTYGEEAVV